MTIQYSNTQETISKMNTKKEPTSVLLPEGVNFFSFQTVGAKRIDILPFITTKDPSRKNPHCGPGMAHPERTWFAHRNLGLDGRSTYVCLYKTFGQKCPVCDFERKSQDEELKKSLWAQQRQLWAVIDLDDRAKGIQVWDAPVRKSFGEKFAARLGRRKYDNYFHLKGGLTLELTVEDRAIGTGKPFKDVVDIDFAPREDYDESILAKVPCLDELLIKLDYAKLDRILKQEPEPEDDSAPSASTGIKFGPNAAGAEKASKITKSHDIGITDLVFHEGLGNCRVVKLPDTDEGVVVWLRTEPGEVLHKGTYKGKPITPSDCKLLDEE